MSAGTNSDEVNTERTSEEKLKALVRKDIDPEITRLATAALKRCQEDSA